MCQTSDLGTRRIHRENAGRIYLASFPPGLTGTPGKHLTYVRPRDIGQALSIALAVQETEHNNLMKVSMRNSIIQLDC